MTTPASTPATKPAGKRGGKPINDTSMTDAERQARHRAKLAHLTPLEWTLRPGGVPAPYTGEERHEAEALAALAAALTEHVEALNQRIGERLAGEGTVAALTVREGLACTTRIVLPVW